MGQGESHHGDSELRSAFEIPAVVLDRLESRTPTVLEVYGELTETRISKLKDRVLGLDPRHGLVAVIDSPGGSATALGLCELIHRLCIPRVAIVVGQAYSNAFMLLGSFPAATRFGTRSSTYLTHSNSTRLEIGGRVDQERGLIGGHDLADWIAAVTNWYQVGFAQERQVCEQRKLFFPDLDIDGEHLRADLRWTADMAVRLKIIDRII